ERSGFRESVSLDHGVTEPMPEFFGRAVEGCAAADHRPEFPSEAAADGAKRPPPAEEMLGLGTLVVAFELSAPAGLIEIALNFLLQRFDHARHSDEYRDALAANRGDDFRGIERIGGDHGSADQGREKHAEKLSEDMTQRKQIQKTQRVDELLV